MNTNVGSIDRVIRVVLPSRNDTIDRRLPAYLLSIYCSLVRHIACRQTLARRRRRSPP
jgi:hypothetical protein